MDTLKKTTTGVSVLAQVLDRDISSQNYHVNYAKVYISRDDCSNGYGKIVFSALSNNGGFSSDYVQGGSSMGSLLADNLCGTLKN